MRCAIDAVLTDRELQVSSPRSEKLHKLGEIILERVTAGDAEMTLFDNFSAELLGILKGLLQSTTACRSLSSKREKLWCLFHQARLLTLPEIWERLLRALDIPYDDDLLQQSANKELFEMILQAQFSVSTSSQSCAATSSQSLELPSDELNALRYACGYVPYALLKRYEKRSSNKYDEFIECLGEMAVHSDVGSEDFLSYTREWLEKVNRGGLFPLND